MRATSACELFHRCIDRRGGEEWHEFHRRYHPHVKKAVRQALVQGGFAVPEPDLEEIVQDLYCRLLASGRPFRGRSETELWCYLGRIARNLAFDRRRAARARKRWLEAANLDPGSPGHGATGFRPLGRTPWERAEELVSSEPSPEERCVLNDCRRIFVARCREVVRGERARKILRLAILEGWSSREIARRLGGMTPNQVDVLLCRLKKRLAKEGIRLPRRRGGCKSPSPPARGPTGRKRVWESGRVPPMLRIFTDPRCSQHRSPAGFPERQDRLDAVMARLAKGPWPVDAEVPAGGADEAIAAVHDRRYVERLHSAVERGDGLIDSADNPLSAGTWGAATAAVEVALAAADWVGSAPGHAAFAAVRPPGHHAERSFAMGFCYFNNAAVAAEHLIRRHGVERVAIFDFDVHHGNGTQHIFEQRSDVVYASLHQFPFYPGTGAPSETGHSAGEGATLNVPLPAGTGDDGYRRAFEERILPALRHAAPQALVVSAGFDAWRRDPLGGMAVTEAGFEEWGRMLAELAAEVAQGRVLSLLEGGYDLAALGELVERYLSGLRPAG